MKVTIRREHLDTCTGWLTSAIIHLVVLIGCTLLLAPLAGNRSEVIEIESAFVDVGEEMTVVELAALPTLEIDQSPFSEPMPVVAAELEVLHPGLVRSGGRGGDGGSTMNSGNADGLATRAGDANAVSFFGTQASGNRFVYVLDISTSMNAERIRRAVLELLRSIDELHEYQQFYVITFSWQTGLMFDDTSLIPTSIPATLHNKQRLRAWLAGLQTGSGTDPREALSIGLSLRPDALFLLSDGEFNKPPPKQAGTFLLVGSASDSAESVIDVVRSEKCEGLPIHTVAFEVLRSEPEMKRIAVETHGIHRFVPAVSTKDAKRKSSPSLRSAVMSFRFSGESSAVTVKP